MTLKALGGVLALLLTVQAVSIPLQEADITNDDFNCSLSAFGELSPKQSYFLRRSTKIYHNTRLSLKERFEQVQDFFLDFIWDNSFVAYESQRFVKLALKFADETYQMLLMTDYERDAETRAAALYKTIVGRFGREDKKAYNYYEPLMETVLSTFLKASDNAFKEFGRVNGLGQQEKAQQSFRSITVSKFWVTSDYSLRKERLLQMVDCYFGSLGKKHGLDAILES